MIRQAVPRGATVKPAKRVLLGAMLRGKGRSVPRGDRIEKTTVQAGPGNRGHSRSEALTGRGAKHPRAEERRTTRGRERCSGRRAASVPRGVRIEKTTVRARPGNRGRFGKPGFKGPRHEASASGGLANDARPERCSGRTAPASREASVEKRRGRGRGRETEVIREAWL